MRHLSVKVHWAAVELALLLALAFAIPASAADTGGMNRPVAEVRVQNLDYLRVAGKTFQATIYEPQGRGPFPAILDVHGGAWTREDVSRDEHQGFDRALAATGIVVAAIDYRQSGQSRYPDSVEDVNYAIRWLKANATKFHASPRKIGIFASSSGGHLVLLNAMRPSDPRYSRLALPNGPRVSAEPAYLILVYPISDPAARRAYAQQLGNDAPVKSTDIYFSPPESLADGNPQRILDRHERVKLPPILLIQGSADAAGAVKDTNMSPDVQQRFAASYQAAGGRIDLEMLPGAPHNFVNGPSGFADRALVLTRAFVTQELARR